MHCMIDLEEVILWEDQGLVGHLPTHISKSGLLKLIPLTEFGGKLIFTNLQVQ